MYKILMRDNETKDEKIVHFDMDWHSGSLFLWREGNFSCYCNRCEFFHNAESECGSTRITAIHAELESGEIISIDA